MNTKLSPVIRGELITEAQSDLTVVNAARVSFAKESEWDDGGLLLTRDEKLIRFLARNRHWTPFAHTNLIFARSVKNIDLINWLINRKPGFETAIISKSGYETTIIESGSVFAWIENADLLPVEHWSLIASKIRETFPTIYRVFELKIPETYDANIVDYTALSTVPEGVIYETITELGLAESEVARLLRLTFRCHAPFPIARQAFKHKYGFVENEISRRYVTESPEFFRPDYWRKKAENVKQGSSLESVEAAFGGKPLDNLVEAHLQSCERLYNGLIEADVCAEQARFVLPNATMTSWYWTGTLDAYCRFFRDRTPSDAQLEVRALANSIFERAFEVYPRTISALA
ncbi:FAD-dependent thymidylate synthase [Roseibium aggregatum]|uniref:Thymidylate synthase ThyX n=1 Tax=Roseibium aggregatum TaxID=187304 RepID=A0A0M6Y811_9HYPH|nr:FAD-dependent thymidylate synthase [Roseibium aggregatum]CTQ45673.1 Thymidylate synthase ThyX [Roseibium aggregatum]